MFETEEKVTALHEAGHAAVAALLGARFRYVTLRPRDPQLLGRVYAIRSYTTVYGVIKLAGAIAGRSIMGAGPDFEYLTVNGLWGNGIVESAVVITTQAMPAIEELATHLMAQRTLTHRGVCDILSDFWAQHPYGDAAPDQHLLDVFEAGRVQAEQALVDDDKDQFQRRILLGAFAPEVTDVNWLRGFYEGAHEVLREASDGNGRFWGTMGVAGYYHDIDGDDSSERVVHQLGAMHGVGRRIEADWDFMTMALTNLRKA